MLGLELGFARCGVDIIHEFYTFWVVMRCEVCLYLGFRSCISV